MGGEHRDDITQISPGHWAARRSQLAGAGEV